MIKDIKDLLEKYGFDSADMDDKKLDSRMMFLKEEYDELIDAYDTRNSEEFVDALIDMCVIAIGTLELCGVDTQRAWSEVHRANMSKERGMKPGREYTGGWDLKKPDGWVSPSHEGNTGNLPDLL